MSAYRGAVALAGIFRGATAISAVYRGTTVVWAPGVGDDFNQANGPLSSRWTDLGTAPDWKLGVQDGRARVLIPDALIGFPWDSRISTMRYNFVTAPGDDGFVECRPGTKGDTSSLTKFDGFQSFVHGKGNNTGGTHTNSAGIFMQAGHVWISKVVSGTQTQVADCGTFQSGDVIRCTYGGTTATLTVNGAVRGTGLITGVASNASNRSLIIHGEGGKDLFGPRRFSPALDYVLMG